jgi:hypothetical protein
MGGFSQISSSGITEIEYHCRLQAKKGFVNYFFKKGGR